MDAVLWGDLFRFSCLVVGAGSLSLSLWVAVNYGIAYRRARRSADGWRGLLPRHVAAVGLSYAILVMLVLYEHTGNENPLSWREPVDLAALLLGLAALRDMTKQQQYRKVRLPGEGETKHRRPKRR